MLVPSCAHGQPAAGDEQAEPGTGGAVVERTCEEPIPSSAVGSALPLQAAATTNSAHMGNVFTRRWGAPGTISPESRIRTEIVFFIEHRSKFVADIGPYRPQ
jgi:hypothetical protein